MDAAAILDRLLDCAADMNIKGPSWRIREHQALSQTLAQLNDPPERPRPTLSAPLAEPDDRTPSDSYAYSRNATTRRQPPPMTPSTYAAPQSPVLDLARMRAPTSSSRLAIAYLLALTLQISTNLGLAVSGGEGTHQDLLGFVAMLVLGPILALREYRRHTFSILAVFTLLLFWVLLSVNLFFTSSSQLISIFLSKYGIVTWCIAGGFASLAVSTVAADRGNAVERRRLKRAVFTLPMVMLLLVYLNLRDYASSPYIVESYQFAATNLTILLAVVLMAAAHWSVVSRAGAAAAGFQAALLIIIGTYLAYLVARMNSTSIVLVWTVFLLLFAAFMGHRLMLGKRSLLIGSLVLGAIWFKGTGTFATFIDSTRFAQADDGNSGLSSILSRSELVRTFSTQFKVDPIFGNFSAEVVAGFRQGQYVHSVPLSLLTHTGVLGFVLFVLAIVSLIRRQRAAIAVTSRARSTVGQRFSLYLFYAVLVIGAWTAFFTWIPLWFMIGYIIVGSRRVVAKNISPGSPRQVCVPRPRAVA